MFNRKELDDWFVAGFYWLALIVMLGSVGYLIVGLAYSVLGKEEGGKKTVSLGVHEITNFHAVTKECGNSRGYGAYGKRIAVKGRPLGSYVAANFLPAHTKIVIPKLYGNRVFMVEDRLAGWVKKGRVDVLVPVKAKCGLSVAEVFEIKKGE